MAGKTEGKRLGEGKKNWDKKKEEKIVEEVEGGEE